MKGDLLNKAFANLAETHAKAIANDPHALNELLRLLRSDKIMDVASVGVEAADVIDYLKEQVND